VSQRTVSPKHLALSLTPGAPLGRPTGGVSSLLHNFPLIPSAAVLVVHKQENRLLGKELVDKAHVRHGIITGLGFSWYGSKP